MTTTVEQFRCCDTCRNVNACAIKGVCRKERWKQSDAGQAVPVTDQIKCVKREIAMRERVYPSFVARGKLKPHEAEWQIEAMKAVLATLESRSEGSQDASAH